MMRKLGVLWVMGLAFALGLPAHAQNPGAPPAPSGQISGGSLVSRGSSSPEAAVPGRAQAGSTVAFTSPSLGGLGLDYRISVNDLFDVEVFNVPDLKRTVRVNASGLVSLAMLGPMSVVGLTAEEAEVKIAAAYAEKFLQDPQVSVFIREFSAQQVTLEGAVRSPGIYTYTGQLTLLQAIARAGGRGELADYSNITIFRKKAEGPGTLGRVYDANEIQNGAIDDPILKPDDVIVVKRSPGRIVLRDSIISDVIGIFNPFSYIRP